MVWYGGGGGSGAARGDRHSMRARTESMSPLTYSTSSGCFLPASIAWKYALQIAEELAAPHAAMVFSMFTACAGLALDATNSRMA